MCSCFIQSIALHRILISESRVVFLMLINSHVAKSMHAVFQSICTFIKIEIIDVKLEMLSDMDGIITFENTQSIVHVSGTVSTA